jgi:hypothetical protein
LASHFYEHLTKDVGGVSGELAERLVSNPSLKGDTLYCLADFHVRGAFHDACVPFQLAKPGEITGFFGFREYFHDTEPADQQANK